MKQWGSLLCWRLKEEIDNRKEVGGKLDYTDSCSKAASAFFQVDICRFLWRFSTCSAFRSSLYVPFSINDKKNHPSTCSGFFHQCGKVKLASLCLRWLSIGGTGVYLLQFLVGGDGNVTLRWIFGSPCAHVLFLIHQYPGVGIKPSFSDVKGLGSYLAKDLVGIRKCTIHTVGTMLLGFYWVVILCL